MNTDSFELTAEEKQAIIERALANATDDKRQRLEAQRKNQERIDRETEWRRHWNAEELFQYIEYRAANDLKIEFRVDDTNRALVRMLCLYFTDDPLFETENKGYGLNKGICLAGNVGTGKTTLMRLFGRNKRQCYNVVSCRKISALYAEDGHTVFDAYRGPVHDPAPGFNTFFQKQVGFCFDDLGTEETKKHFGNQVNVMAEILLNRYDEKHRYPWTQTHITTNLTADQVEADYGTRVRSRLREMFNIIVIDGDDRRK